LSAKLEANPSKLSGVKRPKLFLKYASQRVCILRSLKVALVVGTVLALINHSDAIFSGALTAVSAAQILVTYAVPYSVSTFGSAMQGTHMELQGLGRKLDPDDA